MTEDEEIEFYRQAAREIGELVRKARGKTMANEIEYRTADKSQWGPGPWQDEPDKKQWTDPAIGLPCLIVRNINVTGALCGYVGLPSTHPLHGKHYDEAHDAADIDVHGGLTYAAGCQHGDDPAAGICHIPQDGDPDDVWWLGFDCSHAGDLMPAMSVHIRRFAPDYPIAPILNSYQDETYRDLPYVEGEVTRLAAQLKAIK